MCVKTLCAWKIGKKPNGKDLITFTAPARAGKGEFLQLPCGQCIECRLERSRVWAIRCMHEASLSEQNCFITLTFNDYFVDPRLSLDKCDFRNFMKRLRKHLSGGVGQAKRVRYFHAGEYGEQFERPHHHAILFGFDFPDKVLRRQRDGFNYYESALLKRLWALNIGEEKALSLIEDGVNRKQEWVFQYNEEWYFSFGFTEISDVTFESCAYVARYCTKKINGSQAEEHYSIVDEQGNVYKREPEFSTMSRRPGIGLEWYEKYKDTDVWAHDRVHIRGNKFCTPPRYYGNKFEISNPVEYTSIKEKRLKKMKDNPDNRFERQPVREAVKMAQFSMLKRSLT